MDEKGLAPNEHLQKRQFLLGEQVNKKLAGLQEAEEASNKKCKERRRLEGGSRAPWPGDFLLSKPSRQRVLIQPRLRELKGLQQT